MIAHTFRISFCSENCMTLADGRIGLKRSPVCAGHGNGNLIRSIENIMRNRGMARQCISIPAWASASLESRVSNGNMTDIRLTCIVHSMFVQRSYCIVCCSRPINLIRIQCNAAWRRMHYRERTCILSQKSTNNIDFTTACVAVSLLHDCACTALRR